jgi:hypothetical protein
MPETIPGTKEVDEVLNALIDMIQSILGMLV